MTNEEARAYFIDSNERIISVAKDENCYNYETQQIEDVFMRRDFEAKELAIQALEQREDVLDKIRAEIEETYINITYQENKDRQASWGLRKALEILDKYKAESGGMRNDRDRDSRRAF